MKNIFHDHEIDKSSTVAKNATVQKEAGRVVKREIEFYNLDVIIAVGYRVNSKKGTQFRQWATQRLREYLVKGVAINQKGLEQLTDHKTYREEFYFSWNSKLQFRIFKGIEYHLCRNQQKLSQSTFCTYTW